MSLPNLSTKSVDFGIFSRPNGEKGRLILDIAPSGNFTLSHIVTPNAGTLVARGQFHDYISGLSEASIRHLEGLSALQKP